MKRIIWFSLAVVLPAIMVACGKSNNSDTTIAAAPLTNQCLNQTPATANGLYANSNYYYGGYGYNYGYPTAYNYNNSYYPYSQQIYPQANVPTATCDNNVYNQYYGFIAYPGVINNLNYTSGMNLCDCGSGWRPVYNNQLGMGCISNSVFTTVSFGGAFYYTLAANNSQWVNIPQVSNTQGYSNSNSCYQNVAQACWVDIANSCGAGNTCIATSGGSRLGICSRQ